MGRSTDRSEFVAIACLAAGLIIPSASSAANIEVTTTQDPATPGSGCTLRQAITAAQTDTAQGACVSGSGSDTISLPEGSYVTAPGAGDENANAYDDFDVLGTDALTIQAAAIGANVSISGGGRNRVIDHRGAGLLTLRNLTVTGGAEQLSPTEPGCGGGIYSLGGLQLDGVSVVGNASEVCGGGIYAAGGLEVVNSTIAENSSAESGGGIQIAGSEPVLIESSTIARNSATAQGSGFNVQAVNPHEGAPATVSMSNVLLADNYGTENECYAGYADDYLYPRYLMTTDPLEAETRCLETAPEVLIIRVDDSGLGQLSTTGAVPTIALEAGSPAVRAGSAVGDGFGCPAVDQLGNVRPEGRCDIGAVRYEGEFPFSSLKLAGPKRIKPLGLRHRKRTVKVGPLFVGSGQAADAFVCVKPGGWRRAVRLVGKRCRRFAKLDAGSTNFRRFNFIRRRHPRAGTRHIRITLGAPRFQSRTLTFKLKVR